MIREDKDPPCIWRDGCQTQDKCRRAGCCLAGKSEQKALDARSTLAELERLICRWFGDADQSALDALIDWKDRVYMERMKPPQMIIRFTIQTASGEIDCSGVLKSVDPGETGEVLLRVRMRGHVTLLPVTGEMEFEELARTARTIQEAFLSA